MRESQGSGDGEDEEVDIRGREEMKGATGVSGK